jgi:hypothetical protein
MSSDANQPGQADLRTKPLYHTTFAFMPKPLDLKSSLNLPRTAFPMKAGLPQNEPRMLAEWEQGRLYDRIQSARAGAPSYVLHDGPPYPTARRNFAASAANSRCDMLTSTAAISSAWESSAAGSGPT